MNWPLQQRTTRLEYCRTLSPQTGKYFPFPCPGGLADTHSPRPSRAATVLLPIEPTSCSMEERLCYMRWMSMPGGTGLGATCLVEGVFAHGRRVGTRWLLRSLPTQTILCSVTMMDCGPPGLWGCRTVPCSLMCHAAHWVPFKIRSIFKIIPHGSHWKLFIFMLVDNSESWFPLYWDSHYQTRGMRRHTAKANAFQNPEACCRCQ